MRDYEECLKCPCWNPDTESPYPSSVPIDACYLCDMSEEDIKDMIEGMDNAMKEGNEKGTKI